MTDAARPIEVGTPADWDDIHELLRVAFLETYDADARETERLVFEPERSLLVRDGGQVVAHAGAFGRELSVPGGVLPAAHVTQVSVAPTHRRRGLLTRLMHRQLREIRDAGREPVAVLWASEGRIYPRYGYGLAAQRLRLLVDSREVRLAPAGGRLRTADPTTVRAELTRVYETVRASRPGRSSRDDRWWRYLLIDLEGRRDGATERRAVLHEGPDGVDGYALYRLKSNWDDGGPRGTVLLNELTATGPAAYAALWAFLLSVDLTRTVDFHHAAVDEPLLHLTDEHSRLGARLRDGLWIRVVDVPAALAARRYATPVDLVIEVSDPLLTENAGRWRLTGDASGARCVATSDPADLACDVRDLGAVYLGGPSIAALAAAGRVRELRPGATVRTAAAFAWHPGPEAVEVF